MRSREYCGVVTGGVEKWMVWSNELLCGVVDGYEG